MFVDVAFEDTSWSLAIFPSGDLSQLTGQCSIRAFRAMLTGIRNARNDPPRGSGRWDARRRPIMNSSDPHSLLLYIDKILITCIIVSTVKATSKPYHTSPTQTPWNSQRWSYINQKLRIDQIYSSPASLSCNSTKISIRRHAMG